MTSADLMSDRREHFMKLAYQLARKAYGKTWPNPMVGAVVVSSGQVVGSGYHRKAGLDHAEVAALEQAGSTARGADLYVTLEPCHLTGRTGPCTEKIRQAGIKRVFVGTQDPNPNESGRGIAVLRSMGVLVEENLLGPACSSLNEVYNTLITKKRPFVQVKMAASLDGRTATRTGDSKWISSKLSRKHVHRLRALAQAVMVGSGTVKHDDPRLNVRDVRGKNPAVVVLDTDLSISAKSRLFSIQRGSPVLIYCKRRTNRLQAERLKAVGAEIRPINSKKGFLDLEQVLRDLFDRNICRLLVEGGPTLFGSLLNARLVDRLELHLAPRLLGSMGLPLAVFRGSDSVKNAPSLAGCIFRHRGPDMCLSATVEWP